MANSKAAHKIPNKRRKGSTGKRRGAATCALSTLSASPPAVTVSGQQFGSCDDIRSLLNATTDLAVLIDPKGMVLAGNEAMLKEVGLAADQLVGRFFGNFTSTDLFTMRLEWIKREMASGKSFLFEDLGRNRGREYRIFPVTDGNGKIVAYAIFSRDITDRHTTEKALEEARERAEKANAAKTRFLAAASHDLRQPVQALNNFIEILSVQVEDLAAQKTVIHAAESVSALNSMLSVLLDISRLEAGLIKPETSSFPLDLLFNRLRSAFWPRAQSGGTSLKFMPCSAQVITDPVLLERIIGNLLSNAVRYAQGARVICGCRQKKDGVTIQVWDNGPGIPSDQLEKIFHEFHQVEVAHQRRREGLGLGLAIVERLCKLLGHEVRVRSVPGRYTVFSVDMFRQGKQITPMVQEVAGGNIGDALIAIIDDQVEISDSLTESFRLRGLQAVGATSLQQLLRRLRRLRHNSTPDLVIADYRLGGGITGIDLLEAMQAHYGPQLAGMLLSGDTAPDRLKEAIASGFLLLHKPTSFSQIFRVASQVITHNRAKQANLNKTNPSKD